jgi:hypothetical protein
MDNERLVTATRRLRAQLTEAAAVLDDDSEEKGWLVVPDADAA